MVVAYAAFILLQIEYQRLTRKFPLLAPYFGSVYFFKNLSNTEKIEKMREYEQHFDSQIAIHTAKKAEVAHVTYTKFKVYGCDTHIKQKNREIVHCPEEEPYTSAGKKNIETHEAKCRYFEATHPHKCEICYRCFKKEAFIGAHHRGPCGKIYHAGKSFQKNKASASYAGKKSAKKQTSYHELFVCRCGISFKDPNSFKDHMDLDGEKCRS